MSFFLEQNDLQKARAVAERALSAIDFRYVAQCIKCKHTCSHGLSFSVDNLVHTSLSSDYGYLHYENQSF